MYMYYLLQKGETPLQIVVNHGANQRAIQMLIDGGADVNIRKNVRVELVNKLIFQHSVMPCQAVVGSVPEKAEYCIHSRRNVINDPTYVVRPICANFLLVLLYCILARLATHLYMRRLEEKGPTLSPL